MAACELCGIKPARFNTEIEGTMMSVCEDCSRFGKVKGSSNVKIVYKDRKKIESDEPEYIFVSGYGSIVKNARERMGLKQEEMAKKLNERESLLHQIESEHLHPGIVLAHKLEKALHIHIVDEIKPEIDDEGKKGNLKGGQTGLTLGDLMDKRFKK